MKVFLKSDLLRRHFRRFRATCVGKGCRSGSVTMNVAESFDVSTMGFAESLECEAEEGGRVVVPIKVWENVGKVVGSGPEEVVSFSATDGVVVVGRLRFRHPDIKNTTIENAFHALPIGATAIEIIRHAFSVGVTVVEYAGGRGLLDKHMGTVLKRINHAATGLRDYGATGVDLAQLVARKIGVEDSKQFLEILRELEQARTGKG